MRAFGSNRQEALAAGFRTTTRSASKQWSGPSYEGWQERRPLCSPIVTNVTCGQRPAPPVVCSLHTLFDLTRDLARLALARGLLSREADPTRRLFLETSMRAVN